MKLNAATAGKLASLSALGAGALVMSAGDADASTVFTDLSANSSASVGFTSGYNSNFSTSNPTHGGVGFRFFTNFGSHFSGTTGSRISVRFSGRGLAQFATSAGMLKLFAAGSHLGGAGVSAVGSAAYRSFWKTRNTHYHSAQGFSTGSSGNTHFVTTESAFTTTTYAYGHRAVPKPFADMYALFKFNVGTHSDYGWVELSLINNVDTSGLADNLGPDLKILGWAFDDSGTQIAAGDVGSVPEPGTFGMTGLAALALGAEGIRRWRASKAAQKS